ncbi:hypothetical protein [uncultured Bilophila sp.]|uniref:hypothetical protein n=1 Tax=uncultured Bilophila sp. TaxID=529385 RepID=UPI00280AA031|nr:hypothetical protein [uncultured Bilophila sp.]
MVISSPQRGGKTAFLSNVPIGGTRAEAFYWLFLWNFKKGCVIKMADAFFLEVPKG